MVYYRIRKNVFVHLTFKMQQLSVFKCIFSIVKHRFFFRTFIHPIRNPVLSSNHFPKAPTISLFLGNH